MSDQSEHVHHGHPYLHDHGAAQVANCCRSVVGPHGAHEFEIGSEHRHATVVVEHEYGIAHELDLLHVGELTGPLSRSACGTHEASIRRELPNLGRPPVGHDDRPVGEPLHATDAVEVVRVPGAGLGKVQDGLRVDLPVARIAPQRPVGLDDPDSRAVVLGDERRAAVRDRARLKERPEGEGHAGSGGDSASHCASRTGGAGSGGSCTIMVDGAPRRGHPGQVDSARSARCGGAAADGLRPTPRLTLGQPRT